jgi:dihydrofolate reductase
VQCVESNWVSVQLLALAGFVLAAAAPVAAAFAVLASTTIALVGSVSRHGALISRGTVPIRLILGTGAPGGCPLAARRARGQHRRALTPRSRNRAAGPGVLDNQGQRDAEDGPIVTPPSRPAVGHDGEAIDPQALQGRTNPVYVADVARAQPDQASSQLAAGQSYRARRTTWDPCRGRRRACQVPRRRWDLRRPLDRPVLVLTHHPQGASDDPKATFFSELEQALATARDAAEGKNVEISGRTSRAQCLDAGFIDEIVVHIAPVLLGTGCGSMAARRRRESTLRTWCSRSPAMGSICASAFVGSTLVRWRRRSCRNHAAAGQCGAGEDQLPRRLRWRRIYPSGRALAAPEDQQPDGVTFASVRFRTRGPGPGSKTRGWRWRSSCWGPPRTAGGRSTARSWSRWCAPALASTRGDDRAS